VLGCSFSFKYIINIMDKHKLTDVEQFIKKFHEDKKQNKLDLSLDEDL